MQATTFRDRASRLALPMLIAASALLGACTTVVREPAPPQRVVYREMPAPIIEVVPAPPGPAQHWVPGHWTWREGRWQWFGGRYVAVAVPPMPAPIVEIVPMPPSPRHAWVRGHWQWGGSGWVWARGTWVFG